MDPVDGWEAMATNRNKKRIMSLSGMGGDGDLDRLSIERVSGSSAGPFMSTPKHSETGRGHPHLFDPGPVSRISNTPSQKSTVIRQQHGEGGSGSKAVFSLVSRSRTSLYFGFVAVGDSQTVEQLLLNVSGEQLRVRCSLEQAQNDCERRKEGRDEGVFKIESISSMIIEPGARLAISVRYTPKRVEMNADTKLVIERTNGDYQRYSFKLLGYGGRGELRLADRHFNAGLAHLTPSGLVVLVPDLYPPPSVNFPIRFFFVVENKGMRPCFASVRALRTTSEQELSSDYVQAHPSRFVISNEEGKNTQQLMIRVNEQLSGKPTVSSARCFGPPNTLPSDDTEFRLLIIWGEEQQRQRLKTWETLLCRKCTAYGQSFTEGQFNGESAARPLQHQSASQSQADRPFENEDEEFINSLRVIRINVVDNRALTRLPPVAVLKRNSGVAAGSKHGSKGSEL